MSKSSSDFFDEVLKELETKIQQIDNGLKTGHSPTRKEFESFTWKTGRVIRQIVKPEANEDRKTFWSECKGVLKKIIVIEKFNAGVFTPDCVREDVNENDLLLVLQKLEKYGRARKDGTIAKPDKPLQVDPAEKKRKLEEQEAEAKKAEDKSKWKDAWKRSEDKGRWSDEIDKDKWLSMANASKKWDDEESDPDEPCPDMKRYGNCTYGRQCGFCNRT